VTLTFGSLFAGVGGFDLGLEAAGWQCQWQVEWDPHCQQVLGYHWPDVPKWWDVSDVSGKELPPVDVITFGSPCQDLSVAGKRAGLEGGRSGLFFEATRIIKEMRHATGNTFPRWAIWENVAGAFNSSGGDDFEAVLQEMGNLGSCHLEWHCLDAQFFGVPQRRRRVFVIACFDSAILERGGQPICAVPEGRRRNSKKSGQKGKESPREASAGFGDSGFSRWSETETAITLTARDHKSANTVIAFSHTQGLDAQPSEINNPTLRRNGTGMAVMLNDGIAPTLRSGGDGGVPSSRGEHLVIVDDEESDDDILIIDGRRTNDVRITKEPVWTMEARMGTGGNNVPMLAIPIADHATRYTGGSGRTDGKSNGLGVGQPGDPMNTLTKGDRHAVAIESYEDTAIGD